MNNLKYRSGKISPFYLYWITIGIFTIILISRLFSLQVVHQSEYRLQSNQNRIREITVQPLRGQIFDRNGILLVDNDPAFTLYGLPYFLQNNPDRYDSLASYLGRSSENLQEIVKKNMIGYFKPVRLARQLDFSIVSKIEENRGDFLGVDFWVEPIRNYPSSVKSAHLFGYLGEISPSELENDFDDTYEKGDIIGKKGIERFYETTLHGKPGVRYAEVDVMGREIRTLEDSKAQNPVPGDNVYLTIDSDLQVRAETLMDTLRGSIIMMDLDDGGILALVSKPDYSPELLSGVIRSQTWNDLINDPGHPMYDRSIQSVFPPGSTFKLVLALAAITNETIDPEWTVNCPGYFRLGRRPFKCWKLGGHGKVNLYEAIEQSCNVYFYRLGLKVGLDQWSNYTRVLGFGKKTGIDLPLEKSGNVPDKTYLDNQYGEGKWTQGLLLNLSVGQGDLVVTPLQMLKLTSIIAKKGVLFQPHLLRYTSNPLTEIFIKPDIDSLIIEEIPDTAYQIIREGMRQVIHGKKGTGKVAAVANIISAGKTGTAQNPHGDDHAWFIGFAPFESPKVAIVVMVENGGGGAVVAGPKAGNLLRLFFKKQKEQLSNPIAAQNE